LREIEGIIMEKNLVPVILPDLMIKQIVWDDDQWMGYDDIDTIALKKQWANEHCLGGTVAWSIDFNSGPGR
jgi:chitinase